MYRSVSLQQRASGCKLDSHFYLLHGMLHIVVDVTVLALNSYYIINQCV